MLFCAHILGCCRAAGSGNLGSRYGVGRSESPMKSAAAYDRSSSDYGLRASAADRLANDFNKLQGPSAGRVPSYMLHR